MAEEPDGDGGAVTEPRAAPLAGPSPAGDARAAEWPLRLLEASEDALYVCDLDGCLRWANPAFARLLDRPLSEIVGAGRTSLLPLRDAILHEISDREVAAGGRAQTYYEEMHAAFPGGASRFLLTRKYPIRDPGGGIVAVGVASTDRTEERGEDRALRMSEMLFQQSREAMIFTDPETRIQRVNPAFTRLSGFTEHAVIGHKARILNSGRQPPSFYAAMWQRLADSGHWEGELTNRRVDGHYYTVWCSINALLGGHGHVVGYMAIQTDLSRIRTEESRHAARQGSHDELTDLPNRSLLRDRMNQLILQADRQDRRFALLFIDLDHFKEVNDTLGHPVGDELLREVARRLQSLMRSQDTAARIGGDEFVVLLPDASGEDAEIVARRVMEGLSQPVDLSGAIGYRPKLSMGIAQFPMDGRTVDLLLRNADTAMYAAKLGGRDRFENYAPDMSEKSVRSFGTQTDLGAGISRGELRLWVQGRVRLDDGALVGAEALVRWDRPGHGLLTPAEFLPQLGASGLLAELDTWMFRDAARLVRRWLEAGLWRPAWRMSLNLGVTDLRMAGRVEQLRRILAQEGLQPGLFELEITEEALVNPGPQLLDALEALREAGFALCIDDFGTGYSSLSQLKRLPVTGIKIDRSFVASMMESERDFALVESIVLMAGKLGLGCTAEGVETEAQRRVLLEQGCPWAQGFLFSRPQPAEDFAVECLEPVRADPG